MKNGGRVTVDADEVLELLDEIRKEVNAKLDKLGRFLATGMTASSSAPARQRQTEKASKPVIPETGVEIPSDGWTSYKTKGPAGPNEAGWRFASDREGYVHAEIKALVDRIYETGKVELGGFTYSLSKDEKFLQRNLPQKSRRG